MSVLGRTGSLHRYCLLVLAFGLSLGTAAAQVCPARPAPGSVVEDPGALYSSGGRLSMDLSIGSGLQSGFVIYCYAYTANGTEAPTLRLNPGDGLLMNFTNQIQQFFGQSPQHMHQMAPPRPTPTALDT